jgi:hypothetical protein
MCQLIVYLMLQLGNSEDKNQEMFFRFLMGQLLRTNPKEKPLRELFLQVYNRITVATQIRQS